MGIFKTYANAVKGIAAYGSDPVYMFNMRMYGIRKTFEAIERSCGGKNWGGFERLCKQLHPEHMPVTNTIPDPQAMASIRRGLEQNNLYERVLAGDAGEFANVDMETLNYFWIILGDATQKYASNIADAANSLGWSGYSDPSASWTDD